MQLCSGDFGGAAVASLHSAVQLHPFDELLNQCIIIKKTLFSPKCQLSSGLRYAVIRHEPFDTTAVRVQ